MAVTRGSRGPSKKVNMQPFSSPDPIHLPQRFAALKERLICGREEALTASWENLLDAIEKEVDHLSGFGSRIIPAIEFDDITQPEHTESFRAELRKHGVGIIRGVVPQDTAVEWEEEIGDYFCQNPCTKAAAGDPQLYEVYWSPAQVRARAHPNVLAAQRFAMGVWTSRDPGALVSTDVPVTYADRLRIRTNGPGIPSGAHVDGGSVERWEPDGYGPAYDEIFRGNWQDYDPWESSTRTRITSDLYRGAGSCSIFRAFQGLLALSPMPPGSMSVCPMLHLATAYYLLRPLFSLSPAESGTLTHPQNSILHGALPGYAQSITRDLHPHLQLDKSLVDIPPLALGDYVVWHPDLIHAAGSAQKYNHTHHTRHTHEYSKIAMYLPACPLTQTNALYLCRQRRSFLLGHPGPDFATGGRGESEYAGRPGVQDVSDAGGDDGLRAMGLLPFDEDEAGTEHERRVLGMGNGILFPALYDTCMLPYRRHDRETY